MAYRRGGAAMLAIAVALLALLVAFPATAGPVAGAEADFVARIQGERAAADLPGYSTAQDLVAVARDHAQDMADQNRLHHNPRLPQQVEDWESLGENVGKGPSVDDIHRAFMESASHRAEILSTRFTQVGVGVVERDGLLWVVQVFRRPPAPAPAPAAGAGSEAGSNSVKPASSPNPAPAAVKRPSSRGTMPPPAASVPLPPPPAQAAAGASAGAAGGGAGSEQTAGAAATPNHDRGLLSDPAPKSLSITPPSPREVSVPVAVAAALLVLVAGGVTFQTAADGRPAGRRPVMTDAGAG